VGFPRKGAVTSVAELNELDVIQLSPKFDGQKINQEPRGSKTPDIFLLDTQHVKTNLSSPPNARNPGSLLVFRLDEAG
jgi:hypothetical protein